MVRRRDGDALRVRPVLVAVPLAVAGLLLIMLRRPLARLLLDWRGIFPPRIIQRDEKTGKVFVALLGGFCLLMAAVVTALS